MAGECDQEKYLLNEVNKTFTLNQTVKMEVECHVLYCWLSPSRRTVVVFPYLRRMSAGASRMNDVRFINLSVPFPHGSQQ